jgi:hypothetical protein
MLRASVAHRSIRVHAAAARKTFSSFDDLLTSADCVLVDFYATWW